MRNLCTRTDSPVGRLARHGNGSVTVEFVASLPIIVAALALTYEFGRTLWAQQIVTKDIRDAARFLSRQQVPLTDTVKMQAQNLAQTGNIAGGTAHFPWTADSSFTVSDPYLTFTSPGFRTAGSVLRIEGDVPMVISFLSFLGINTSVTLRAEDQIREFGN